jgi:rhamnogalacturonan endolyase
MHFTDIDPSRPGLEVLKANGDGPHPAGIQLRDAATGEQLFGVPSKLNGGMARAVTFDVDPRHPGLEMWGYDTPGRGRWGAWWASRRRFDSDGSERKTTTHVEDSLPPWQDRPRSGATGLYDSRGTLISEKMPGACNMGIWWDGDLLRELLNGVRITKWDFAKQNDVEIFDAEAFQCAANNGSKSNPCLCADILGDWREEIVTRTRDNRELRIFVTTIPAERRLVTLMHDPIYRLAVAWQNVGYNQSAHPGFYLGNGLDIPPRTSSSTMPK